jgi:putative ABC transport system permease protein
MRERRREFAILRALGARRGTVFTAIVAESTALASAGALLGFFAYAGIVLGAAWAVREQTGVVLELARAHPSLVGVPVGTAFLGALAGLIPARAAYATDVATNLSGG